MCVRRRAENLLLIILSLVVDDVEEAELVNTLGGGNDTEPVTELLLLEELLGTVNGISMCFSTLATTATTASR